MRGTVCWSDHRITPWLFLTYVHHSATELLDAVSWTWPCFILKNVNSTYKKLAEKLQLLDGQSATSSAEEKWSNIKDIAYKAASEVLGHAVSKHKDWFDDQDAAARNLLDAMHSAHLQWINDKSNTAKKSAYTRTKQQVQVNCVKRRNAGGGPRLRNYSLPLTATT